MALPPELMDESPAKGVLGEANLSSLVNPISGGLPACSVTNSLNGVGFMSQSITRR